MSVDERERRESPRFLVELNVAFRDLGRPDESFADVARNISEGGVFIETSVGLPVGTPVAVEVRGPGRGAAARTTAVIVEGEVVRVEWDAGTTGSTTDSRTRGLAVGFRPGQGAVATLLRRARQAARPQEIDMEGEAS